jgi:hypothetical protein
MRGSEVMQNQNRFVVPPWAQAINRGDDAQIGVKRQSSGVRHTYLESGENKLPMALRSGVRTTRKWQGPVFPPEIRIRNRNASNICHGLEHFPGRRIKFASPPWRLIRAKLNVLSNQSP